MTASTTGTTEESAAERATALRQVVDLVAWLGEGRKLTQKGAITLADARVLVERLDTGDTVDPVIGDRTFKTKSSTELLGLSLVVEWARAARLVRTVRGRLVPVRKSAPLLDRPLELWMRLFEVFDRLGPAFLAPGLGESLWRAEFADGVAAVLAVLRARDTVGLVEMQALGWDVASAPYVLDDATEQQLRWARSMNDRDVVRTLEALDALGAVTVDDDSVRLTPLGAWGHARSRREPEPGEAILRVLVTLTGVADPPVWRRLLVPASMSLRRVHDVLQAAMGWENAHLYSFTAGSVTYGDAEPELGFADDGAVRLGDLDADSFEYTYDFGDSWDHLVTVESREEAVAGRRYPWCLDGEGACPPEDCGGVPGYERLREILDDPTDEEHADMLAWSGVTDAGEFDPAAFDLDATNRALATLVALR